MISKSEGHTQHHEDSNSINLLPITAAAVSTKNQSSNYTFSINKKYNSDNDRHL
jgi:hypothetical protein